MVDLNEIDQKLKNTFLAIRKDINNLKANSIDLRNLDKALSNSFSAVRKDINSIREAQISHVSDLAKINQKIENIKENYISREEFEDFKKEFGKSQKTRKKKPLKNKQKGFLMKKFENVVDILAEDED